MLDKLSRVAGATIVGLGLVVAVTEPTTAPLSLYSSDVRLTATALIMGGANGGGTIGDGTMLAVLDGRYANDTRICVSWPAEIAPIYGTTTLGDSIDIGTDNLDAAIREQYKANPDQKIIAVGLSQASESLDAEMTRLANARAAGDTTVPPPDKLEFVVIGDSDRGLLQWFQGVQLPIFDYTAKPIPVTPYNVTVVKGEYDGFGDPPDRWWNLVAMFNAAAGTGFFPGFGSVHYDALWVNLDTVPPQNITTTTNAAGGITTTYLVPTPDLPMLRPLAGMGVPQDVINTLEKVLRPIVDAGYSRNDPIGTGSTPRPSTAAATSSADVVAVAVSTPTATTARAATARAATKAAAAKSTAAKSTAAKPVEANSAATTSATAGSDSSSPTKVTSKAGSRRPSTSSPN